MACRPKMRWQCPWFRFQGLKQHSSWGCALRAHLVDVVSRRVLGNLVKAEMPEESTGGQ